MKINVRSRAGQMAAVMLLVAITGCMRQELAVAPHVAGNVLTATVDMGQDYEWQVYYNLKTNSVVAKKKAADWDLGFESSAEGYHVILNSSKMMYAFNTGKVDFSSVSIKDSAGFEASKKVDDPSGMPDSTAIGNWRNKSSVFIIKDRDGSLYKFQPLSVDESKYRVRFAKLNGEGDKTLELPKDNAYNFVFLSMQDVAVTNVEPPKATWDIVFTSYTYVFRDLNQPYLVTGCLLNTYNTRAVMDSTLRFEQIDHTTLSDYSLSVDRDIIGYNWKTYSFNTGSYIVDQSINYVIRNPEGAFFKLRFIDFTRDGMKGNPKWEYQQL